MTIDCECDMIENNLSMIQLFKEEKIRKANEIVAYGKSLPTEIWGLIKDYAGINLQGKWDLAFRVGRRNAMRQLEQVMIFDAENRRRHQEFQALEQQRRHQASIALRQAHDEYRRQQQLHQRIEAERTQPKPKCVIKEEKATEMRKLLDVVRIGNRIEYTSYDNGPCHGGTILQGTVSKINKTCVSISNMSYYSDRDNVWRRFYSVNVAGNDHKPRVVKNLFKIL